MKHRIPLQELVAVDNTSKAKALVARYGYLPARNRDELVNNLYKLTRDFGDEGLSEIVKIHPHRDVIMHYLEIDKPKPISDRGYSSFEMSEDYIDFLGSKDKDNKSSEINFNKLNEYLPLIAIAGMFALVVTVIATKK